MQFWVVGVGLHGQVGVEDGHLLTAVVGDGLSLSVQDGGDLNCSDGHAIEVIMRELFSI